MRITEIKINNFRAFYGEYAISLGKAGKNLMVYGENGSGKSSLYAALKLFFQASVAKVLLEENVFIPVAEKGTAFISLTIQENASSTISQNFEVNIENGEIIGSDKSIIINANKVKGFFDYKSLLETHLIQDDSTNIFHILVQKILVQAINRFTKKEIGDEWQSIQADLAGYKGKTAIARLHQTTDELTKGLSLILHEIEKNTNIFLHYFDIGLEVHIDFAELGYDESDRSVYGDEALLNIKYAGIPIPKHHFFLNEARLSALAISLYLASVKANPLDGVLKILVLDDILIGLDMSNRLPLLSLLKDHFIEIPSNEKFQIIMTTYDKIWFELVHNYFGEDQWKYIEIFAKKIQDNSFEFPIIKDSAGYLEKAKFYLREKDNKAAAVYIRTEFERIVKTICEKKGLQVIYKTRQKDFTTEAFWAAIKEQTSLDRNLVKQIEIHRGTVMNPFSHYDLEKPEFEKELADTITEVEKLGVIRPTDEVSKYSFQDLMKERDNLEMQLKYFYIGKIIGALLVR